jgi:hypothetical protein
MAGAVLPAMSNCLLTGQYRHQYLLLLCCLPDTWAVFFWLVVVLCIAVLVSVLPARSAARISVRESLSYE